MFKTSRIRLADIYLKQIMDRRLYSYCYQEIIEKFPTFENFKLSGHAMMNINSPDEAVVYYEKALQEKENDPTVLRDLGRALIQTHDYKKANNYYLDSLEKLSKKDDSKGGSIYAFFDIATDFSNLMLKLSAVDPKNNAILKKRLEGFIDKLSQDSKNIDDWQLKKKLANFKCFLAKVQTKALMLLRGFDLFL